LIRWLSQRLRGTSFTRGTHESSNPPDIRLRLCAPQFVYWMNQFLLALQPIIIVKNSHRSSLRYLFPNIGTGRTHENRNDHHLAAQFSLAPLLTIFHTSRRARRTAPSLPDTALADQANHLRTTHQFYADDRLSRYTAVRSEVLSRSITDRLCFPINRKAPVSCSGV